MIEVTDAEERYHEKYRFGIFYPNHIHGVGSPNDILAFFAAIKLVTDRPESEFQFLWLLRHKPVFGVDMLSLFYETKALRVRMNNIPVNRDVLSKLGLFRTETKLNIEAGDLASLFEKVFKILAEDASERIRLDIDEFGVSYIQNESTRLGPIEPLIPSRFFQQLPASAFDDADPPLWLRDEIFDEAFYKDKI